MKKILIDYPKINRILRVYICPFILIILSSHPWQATAAYAQDVLEQKLSVDFKNITLKEALAQLSKQAPVKFVFSSSHIPTRERVTLIANREKLAVILSHLLHPIDIEFYSTKSGFVVVKKKNAHTINQQINTLNIAKSAQINTVSGRVTDEQQQPLVGVSIKVKDTTLGTITDIDGNYQLNMPDNIQGVLIFSFIGYLPAEQVVGNRTSIDVQLVPDAKSFSEVVVMGYGTQKRRDLTDAVASINTQSIKDQPLSNIAEAIAGRLPGVLVQQITGAPGSNVAIKVRGLGSINADNGPLIVLDGQPLNNGGLGLINPNDIEKIDVLKDASATAIYGSRGSNGVVMVTTKRGKAGVTRINFDYYTGLQEITKKMDVLNSQQFAEYSKDAVNTAYLERVPGASINDPNSVRPPNLRYRYARGEFPGINFDDPSSLANYDFQDMIFRQAPISSYQMSASGGTDKVQFAISGNYLNQDGIIKNSGIDRYSLRTNIDAQLTDKLKVGVSMSPSFTDEKRVNSDGHWSDNGIINSALALMPFVPIYQADGTTYNGQVTYASTYNWTGVPNPVANITEIDNKVSNLRLLGNVYAELELWKGLKYRGTFGSDLIYLRQNYFQSSALPLFNQLPPTPTNGFAFSSQNINWVNNHTLNYDFKLGLDDSHSFGILLGMEAQKNNFEQSQVNANRFANDFVPTINAGTVTGGNSLQEQWSLSSYFGRFNYAFQDKYLFNASIRRDGSSRFGRNTRWGTFPSASVGWRVANEPFLKNVSVLSELKLRASYGMSGNNSFGNYAQFSLLSPDNYAFGNNLVNGLATSSIGNDNLTWEKSRQADLGFDIGLWQDRLLLTVDYYTRTTTDLLLLVQVPTLTGFSAAFKNIGKVRNKGVEFSLLTRNLRGTFTWNTDVNFSLNRNKVLALGPAGDPIRSGTGVDESNITVIGKPLGNIYGYQQIGIFQNEAELDTYPHFATTRPGDVKFQDINGDQIINADDRTILGNNQPDFIYGITNSFSFKGFDLNIIAQGVQGGQILNLSRRFYDNLEGNANQLTTVLDRWRSPEQPGNGITPRANSRSTGSNNAVSTRWVESASYFRIRNITLGYKLPPGVLQTIKGRTLRVYAGIQNAFTSSKYLGYNPEVSGYESALTGGVDYGSYPVARTYTIGLNLGF
ncbi:SusC/RagA family TonB-linked outer membrane protein [Dyadobacter alkalitolerans]|uniref:SusC/RagA family TonB-linked outer membrane protein n=1 Tax=Dyadobacter alkalitolerans TaxID=492736 RepID=UPI001E3CD204|nr:TonB-dependent receptor [Dyadobacter alkalitolerans]